MNARVCLVVLLLGALPLCRVPAHAQPAGGAATANPLSVVFDPKAQAVLSAEIPAKVERIRKELGQKFEKGELLVLLDEGAFRLNVQKNQSTSSAAAKNFQVTERLHEGKSASALDLENARKEYAVAAAGLQLAQKELVSCRVAAPFAGRVKRVFVHEHEWVDRGKPLIEVVNDRALQARILLPSTLFATVRVGRKIAIAVNEVSLTVEGVVTHVGEVLDPASATFEIYAEVDNPNDLLRSGMTGILLPAASSGN